MATRKAPADAHREASAGYASRQSATVRECGPPPPIKDVARRERCRLSLRHFCEEYNPSAFGLGWSEDHLGMIARIEEATLCGALFAFAMPRGAGKSTLSRHAALWAISYRHVRYVFFVGANASKAEDALGSIKIIVRFLPEYGADFPEISHPVRALAGIANRAAGQLCCGEPTMIEWGKGQVVLPTVPPPSNWPDAWPLRDDGKAPTSGSILTASGLTGEGIRGSVLTLTTGEFVRPDLVLLDDPQTPESARSPAQNQQREQLIAADLLGLAGPGKAISAVMPCTVICPGDMIDTILDQNKHPLWRGERRGILRSMPTDLAAWGRYFEVYTRCAAKRPPDYAEACAHYQAHRAELDAGADAGWEARKYPWEVSAIQHAMHLYCRDQRAFFSEYQNRPLPLDAGAVAELKADEVAGRLNRHARGTVPAWASKLTAFVDVQQDLLYWAVCGWQDGFGGAVVDYGSWPDQRREYWTLADARPTLSDATGVGSLEGSLWAGLTKLAEQLLGRAWPTAGGASLRVERCLVDAGWGQTTDLVRRWCRESPHAAVLMPSKGMGLGASSNPMSDWPKRPGERRGLNWLLPAPKPGEGRLVLFDANWWKSFAVARLMQPMGEHAAMTLWGDDARAHRMFADHLVSEYRVRTEGRGRKVDEWKLKPGNDNHLWDCTVGCCVAASEQGVRLAELPDAKAPERRRVSYAELQRQAKSPR